MIRHFITLLACAVASTAVADEKPTVPVKDGVVVWDEANEIFMDKRSPEEREADSRTINSKTPVVTDANFNGV